MDDRYFMRLAINQAKRNGHRFGAVIVKSGKVVAYPSKRPVGDPRWHAETQAILSATKKLNSKELKNCTLYSTCEPCVMCFYMAWITKIPRIVYGATLADSIRLGFPEINVTSNLLNKRSGEEIKLTPRVMRIECVGLLEGV